MLVECDTSTPTYSGSKRKKTQGTEETKPADVCTKHVARSLSRTHTAKVSVKDMDGRTSVAAHAHQIIDDDVPRYVTTNTEGDQQLSTALHRPVTTFSS